MRQACSNRTCGVSDHVAGSAAAATCRREALRGTSYSFGRRDPYEKPPPPPETVEAALDAEVEGEVRAGRAGKDLEDEVLSDLRENHGWEPGVVHPTGGYDDVTVVHQPNSERFEVVYSREGEKHRTDGPASVSYRAGQWGSGPLEVSTQTWCERGKRHRADGPAVVIVSPLGNDPTTRWVLQDEVLVDKQHQADDRARRLGSWGANGVTGWLFYEGVAGRSRTRALVRAGVDGASAYDLARQGMDHVEILAVVTRRAPASWARRVTP